MKLLNKHRKIILQLIDILLWVCGAVASIYLIDDRELLRASVLAVIVAVHIIVYHFMSMYQIIWRYAGRRQFIRCLACEVIASVILFLGGELLLDMKLARFSLMSLICTGMFVVTSRIGYVTLVSLRRGGIRPVAQQGIRTLIIGAGEAASIVLKDMLRDPEHVYAPVGLLDDDTTKRGRKLRYVKVYGPIDEIEKFASQLDVQLLVFAIFDITPERKKEILEKCAATGVRVLMAPSPKELHAIDDGVPMSLREVNINDLLGREPVLLESQATKEFIGGRRVLVTGAGGSIGSELCRQIAAMKPSKLILLDVYENGVYDIQQELLRRHGGELDMTVEILSVCDKIQLDRVFAQHRPEIVFHAAAHKHVPLMEDSMEEAVKNNVFGTLNTARISEKYSVRRFVLISTDKAVNPTSVMGATKRCCELMIQTMDKKSVTEFVAVRFGNVLGSNGSVIPLFAKQIQEGGPVTVTHPDICRYFMTIPEAVHLVLVAGSMAERGEIFVLDMGEPVKIADLADKMIRLVGLKPGRDIKIVYTGLRPGEKLYEELRFLEEGSRTTAHSKIFVAAPVQLDEKVFWERLKRLETAAAWGNDEATIRNLQALVPTYHRGNENKNAETGANKARQQVSA